jgi:DNA-binding HxlR family transcriptional regulator
MAKSTNDELPTCPVARALDIIGDRWSLLIVRDTFQGIRRFGEFQSRLDVSRSVLTQRLRALVDDGILLSRPAADGSAYYEYQLSEKGTDLARVIVALAEWGEHHLYSEQEKQDGVLEFKRRKFLREEILRTANSSR